MVYRRLHDMTIDEKIKIAQDLFRAWHDEIWADARVRELLEVLEEKLAASRKINIDLGVFAVCQHCEDEGGGSCCGAGIENRYSPHLLLLNLLLGRELPTGHCIVSSCYFLGKDGCGLLARDILCINYLCASIQKWLSREDLIGLQTVTGEEMETMFRLHEAVKQFINCRSHVH
jgi:hypothetical protein